MGYSLSWAAVRGASRADVLGALELHGTGAREQVPDSPLVGAQLDGWYVVLANQYDHFDDARLLRRLSAGCEVVACLVEEHVMVSSAACWIDGKQIWSLRHDSEHSVDHLEVAGTPPGSFVAIRDRLQREQEQAGGEMADVDHFFDVPVEVARSLTGFAHNGDFDGEIFEVLATSEKRPSWLKKLFRRAASPRSR